MLVLWASSSTFPTASPSTRCRSRDGLQNERATVPLRGKVRLIDALVAAGLKRIEITSFVSPEVDPAARRRRRGRRAPRGRPARDAEGVTFSALCPNPRGLERARAGGIEEIAVFLSRQRDAQQEEREQDRRRDARRLRGDDRARPRGGDARARVRLDRVGLPLRGRRRPEARDRHRPRALRDGLLPGVAGRHDRRGDAAADRADPRDGARRVPARADRDAHARHARHRARERPRRPRDGHPRLRRDRRRDGRLPVRARRRWQPRHRGPRLHAPRHGRRRRASTSSASVEAGKVAESIVGRPLPGKVHQAGVRSLKA